MDSQATFHNEFDRNRGVSGIDISYFNGYVPDLDFRHNREPLIMIREPAGLNLSSASKDNNGIWFIDWSKVAAHSSSKWLSFTTNQPQAIAD